MLDGAQAIAAKTRVGHRWAKGQSGNPSGRKPIPHDVVALAATKTTLAINTLAEVCQNKKANAGARVMAASVLLDRAWGKALARTESRNLNVDLAQLTDAQLFALLQELQPSALLPAPPEDTASSLVEAEPSGNPGDSGDDGKASHDISHEPPQSRGADCPFVEGCPSDAPQPKRKRSQ